MSTSELRKLRDRIEQLERVLGVDQELTTRLRFAFGITPDQAKLLGMMLRRARVTREGAYATLYGHKPDCDQPEWKVLDVQIHRLRAALKAMKIEFVTVALDGWTMEPEHKLKLRERLEAFEEAHAAAYVPASTQLTDGEVCLGIAH